MTYAWFAVVGGVVLIAMTVAIVPAAIRHDGEDSPGWLKWSGRGLLAACYAYGLSLLVIWGGW